MKATEQVSDYIHDTVDKVSKAANNAGDAIGEKGQQFRKTEEHYVGNCQKYIRNNPISSIGVAVAAGFVLSRLLSAR